MTKSEFSLSEVGKEYVNDDWLEEQQPRKETKEQVKETGNFNKLVGRLNTPEKLVSYMEENSTHFKQGPEVKHYQCKPYQPEEFFHRGVGTCENFAIFASYVMDQHGYDVELFYYRGVTSEGEPLPHTVTIFRDEGGKLNYITNVPKGPHETGLRIDNKFLEEIVRSYRES